MKKVNVNIYNSANCYRKAAQLFKDLDAILCPALKNQIVIGGVAFPQDCNEKVEQIAPCVNVEGHWITRATAGEVKAVVQEITEPHNMVA